MNVTMSTPNNACIRTDDENNDHSYDLQLHILSVFVILILSVGGASISVVSSQVKRLRDNSVILNLGKFFGTGVVLATGFIHMLPAAMKALTDPCLPDNYTVYDASAGLLAMVAALIMQLTEYIVYQRYRSIESHKTSTAIDGDTSNGNHLLGHSHAIGFQNDSEAKKISTYLLEFGIALHSVLIGLTLGTATDEFLVLFIALAFHQFFEGMALGAQIARLDHISLRSCLLMIMFFALTTPIGIIIGICIQSNSYNPKSTTSLLMNGILDSISAGILIYVALVHLIAGEMDCHAHTFHALKSRFKVLYFLALYAGAGTMAVIGLWT
ncbi:unnamed protein product [Adineta ricciae]|uniref:Uncharacterized protein n=1 Tax=Adineta ricciae TaxID=249248 RepID=A0A815C7R0_ADIRI|nr:unnamed protein product [Adineta ricciae]CAF1280193.1 unnamed protein product [Adineta ricciae]